MAVADPIDLQSPPDFGAIFVYQRDFALGGEWLLADKLTIEGLSTLELANCDLGMEDAVLVIGVRNDDSVGVGAGAAYVFVRLSDKPDSWTLASKLVPQDSRHGARFGTSVACSGDFIVVGAPGAHNLGVEMGSAHVFRRSSDDPTKWIEVQKLVPKELHLASEFGSEIAMDGEQLIIGAPNHSAASPTGGAAFVFLRAGDQWNLETILAPREIDVADGFGTGLALLGSTLAVGAPGDDDAGSEVGAMYVFERRSGEWVLQNHLLPIGLSDSSASGAVLALDSDALYSGALLENTGGPGKGAVLEYRRDKKSNAWLQTAVLRPSDSAPHDNFGYVAAAGGMLAVGAAKALKPGAVYLWDQRDHRTVASYCTGTAGTVRDCVPGLETVGVPTASFSSEFRIWSRNLPGAHFGMFLFTTAPWALPDLTSSGVCLPSGGVRRSGILWSGGTAGACDGVLDIEWNAFGASLAQEDPALAVPGTTVHGQFVWFEPFGATALTWSDAVAFQLCP
jgi:hypothetical protein